MDIIRPITLPKHKSLKLEHDSNDVWIIIYTIPNPRSEWPKMIRLLAPTLEELMEKVENQKEKYER